MTPDIKELVKRLQRIQVGMANEEEDAVLAAISALEAMAGENDRLNALIGPALEAAVLPLRKYIGELQELNKAAEAERDRLKAALETIRRTSSDPFATERASKALGGAES